MSKKKEQKFTMTVRSQQGATSDAGLVTLGQIRDQIRDLFLEFEFTAYPLKRVLCYFREPIREGAVKGKLIATIAVLDEHRFMHAWQNTMVKRGFDKECGIIELHPMWEHRVPKDLRDAMRQVLH